MVYQKSYQQKEVVIPTDGILLPKGYLLVVTYLLIVLTAHSQKNASVSFEKWISFKQAGSPVVSPDGR
jgi:hypothetical protein